MHYISSDKTRAGSTSPEGMGAGEFFPGMVAGAVARWQETDPGSVDWRLETETDSGLHELILSGAETTRHNTRGDTELT